MPLLNDLRRFDWVLFACALGLTAIGVAFIHSATTPPPEAAGQVASGFFLSGKACKQAAYGGFGLVVCLGLASVDYLVWRKWAYVLYAGGMVALLLLFVAGASSGGSRRWFRVAGASLQPSEMMKLFFILALACYLMYRRNHRTLVGLSRPFLFAVAPMVLILKQPDLGTALVFLPVLFAMLYVAGARPRHLTAVILAGAALAPVMWFVGMNAYQKARITAFIDPKRDPSGVGYHTIESLVAIGSAGWTGHGYHAGPQNLLNKVPEQETDFIFAVIAEEWGFLGGALVLALCFALVWRLFAIASQTREPFGRLAVVGCAAMLAFQSIVNIGMTIRLCPITGLTLPFVSYGGSSLVTNYGVLGIALGVGMRPKFVVAPEDLDWSDHDSS